MPTSDGADSPIDTTGLAPASPADDENVERDETFLEAFDGQQLFCQSWGPADGEPEAGAIALMHGYGEHSSRYDHVAAALVRAGYAVMAIDARGHGRSTGKRSHVDAYEDYLRDYDLLVERTTARWPDQPTFGVGHSNGGLILLRYALSGLDGLEGAVVTSPFVGFGIDVPAAKATAGRCLSRLWPSFSLPTELDPADLSHDQRVVDHYQRDPLVLGTSTARWFTEAMRAQEDLFERADEIEAPFLFLVGGADNIADPKAADRLFHKLGSGDREMEIYPSLYHEILNEPNWADIVGRMNEWMQRHIGPATTEDAA